MRLRHLAFALVAPLLLAASTAEAAGLSGMGKAIFGNSTFRFSKANLKSVPVAGIKVGSVTVHLQKTRLSEVQKAFGGTIHQQGEGSDQASWLCYSTDGSNGPQANVWFIANALGGYEFIMMVAAEAAGSKPAPDCEAAPKSFTLPDFGIPSLGASLDDLKATFGGAGGGKAISYRADEPGADALGTALNAQYLGYIVSGRKVVGIGVGESSAQIIK